MEQQEIQYATFNRRLIAATIDLLIITIFFFPLMHHVNAMIFGDRTIEIILAELSTQTNDNISGSTLLTTLTQEHYFSKYLLSQFILLLMISIYTISFWYKSSTTPGKYLLGCKVVNKTTHAPLTLTQCIFRFCSYAFSALPLFIGFFMIDFNKSKQGIHDYVADSIVIKNKSSLNFFENFRFPRFSKQK